MKILFLLIILILSGCARDKSPSVPASLDTRFLAEVSAEAQPEGGTAPLHAVAYEDEYFTEYVTDFYKLDASVISGGTVFYAGGMLATEFAVLQMSDENSASAARDTLNGYIQSRADAFAGYAPFESAMAEESYAVSNGVYVTVFICAEPSASEEAFMQCFTDSPPKLEGSIEIVEEEPAAAEPAQTPSETPSSEPPAHEPSDPEESSPAAEPSSSAESPPTAEPSSSVESPPTAEPSASIEPSAEPSDSVAPSPAAEQSGPVEPSTAAKSPKPAPSAYASPAPVPEEEIPDTYSKDAIVLAYETGDTSRLSEINLAVLEKCKEVFSEIITEDMNGLEKEYAIHDWIIENVMYDPAEHDHGRNLRPDPNNDNPYGAMVNGKAICYGYSRSFELMTELLGFEVVSIEGDSSGGPHAWNMIVIEGNWYCVDVTWDDSSESYSYFNKSSAFFRNSGHIWKQTDEIAVAEEDMK